MNAAAERMPVSVMSSLTVHAVALGLWVYTASQTARRHATVIGNVDLIIPVKKATAAPMPKSAARAEPAKSTLDFLKMALPAVPHVALPQTMKVPLPDARKPLQAQAPKLQDRGRVQLAPKLDMDFERGRQLDTAKVEARIPARELAVLAQAPKLEEVGRRQVANLPAALAVEERRQQAVALQGMEELSRAARSSRGVAPQAALLRDAAPAARTSSLGRKIASILPEERAALRPAVMPTLAIKQGVEPVLRERRQSASLQDEAAKKGVEIEGPLANRKVTAYQIPEFPQWAKDQGVLEASVAIRFWVDSQGSVLPTMRIEQSSGYGRLDRLAMDSLTQWKFAPVISQQKQWGVITFRFILE